MLTREVFNRYELKYIFNAGIYKELFSALKPHLRMDEFGDEEGFYSISNLYFDTFDNFFHQQNLKRDKFRQKLRLRVYGNITLQDEVFLEIKKKYNGIVNKRRTLMKLGDAYRFLELNKEDTDLSDFKSSNSQILKEIFFLKSFYNLHPKTVLSYDRQALQGVKDPDLRVTFDRNIRSRGYDLKVENGSYGEPIVSHDTMLMEVKVSTSVPLWLVRILNEFPCRRQSFSKYSTYQQNCLLGNITDINFRRSIDDESIS